VNTPILTLLHAISLICIVCVPDAAAQTRICYFGDSITEGWIEAELQPERAYPAITDSILRSNALDIIAIPRGFGGETSADAVRRVDADVLSQRPDLVTVAFGSNDRYVWGDDPAVRVPLQRFADNLRLLVRKMQGSGVSVILLGLPPLDAARFYRYADSAVYAAYGGVERLQRSYDSIIAATALELHCDHVPLAPAFTQPDIELGFDGVHPTPPGHRAMAATLAKRIQQILRGPPPQRISPVASLYPNPFRPELHTWCSITFPAGRGERFIVRITDAAGRIVRNIVYSAHTDGQHIVPWDGRTDQGTRAASGPYTVYIMSDQTAIQSNILLM